MIKRSPQVFASNLNKKFKINLRSIVILAKKILQAERQKSGVNIIFINDKFMKRLNQKFLGKDKTTDVLAFALKSEVSFEKHSLFLGEVYISLDQAKRQAQEYRVSLAQEVKRLVTHGILHLLGYDHKNKKDALTMRKKEEKYLN